MTHTTSHPDLMLVFDLDGVITDPETGELHHEVLRMIAKDLRQKLPTAFISGRTLKWINEKVLSELSKLSGADGLSTLFLVAEKGGVTASPEAAGRRIAIDKKLSPPESFKRDTRALLDEDQGGWSFGDTMFWDEKYTMVTFEKIKGVPQTKFNAARAKLLEPLDRLLKKHDLNDFIIDTTTVGTDVEHKTAGKKKGGEDVLDWLANSGIRPKTFYIFGDSPSDAGIAKAMAAKGSLTNFIFVGDPAKFSPPGSEPYKTTITGGGYAADTAAYLKKLKGDS